MSMTKAFELAGLQPVSLGINKAATNFVEVNGIRLCYLDQGQGETVLLIHGGGACIEIWNHQIDFLSRNYRVVAPDCRGHGRSGDSDLPYTHALHVADMIGLLDRLEIPRAHVMGWSDGASFGLYMAMHHPDRVASLIMLGGMYSIRHYSEAAMEGIRNMSAYDYYPYLIELHEELSAVPWPVFFEKCRLMWAAEPDHQLPEMRQVTASALIILGGNDEWGDDSQARELQATIPNCRLEIIPDATHAVHMTHAGMVNTLMEEFLQAQQTFPID